MRYIKKKKNLMRTREQRIKICFKKFTRIIRKIKKLRLHDGERKLCFEKWQTIISGVLKEDKIRHIFLTKSLPSNCADAQWGVGPFSQMHLDLCAMWARKVPVIPDLHANRYYRRCYYCGARYECARRITIVSLSYILIRRRFLSRIITSILN